MLETYLRKAEEGILSSGVKTVNAAIKTSAGKVYWITFFYDFETLGTTIVQLNDSTDNSGTDKWQMSFAEATGFHKSCIFSPPIEFSKGIYLDVASEAIIFVVVGYV